MTEVLEGGCLCGAVRYRAEGRPSAVNYCHCRMCQRGSGAPVVVWATFPIAQFRWTRGTPTIRPSSDIAVRGFCSACGTALMWQGNDQSGSIDVTAGSLDRPEAIAPREHIWTESAVPWLHIEDSLPRYTQSRSG